MAIGDVRLNGAAQRSQQTSASPASFGAGVGAALTNIARTGENFQDTMQSLALAEQERNQRSEDFDAQRLWAQTQGDWSREQITVENDAPETGNGLTNGRMNSLQQSRETFLAQLPERLRPRYEAETQTALENLSTRTYRREYELRNTYESKAVGDLVTDLTANIIQDNGNADDSLVVVDNMLAASNLPEAARTLLREQAEADLLGAEFQLELVAASQNNTPAGDYREGEVVAPGLAPWERGFLNATAKRESGGDYTIRYNGHGQAPAHFDDFSDHPRIFVERPDGRVSSAAGRYQFTATEWDRVSGILNLRDFSPVNQDRAALYLAAERFNRQQGPGEMTFSQILSSGTPEQIISVKRALAPTWEAFETMSDQEFLNTFRGSQGVAGGGTGSAQVPDVWENPRYNNLSIDMRTSMAQAASNTQSQIREQLNLQREQFSLALETAIAAGAVGEAEVNQAVMEGNIPADQAPKLLRAVSSEREARQAAEGFAMNVASGTMMANNADNQAAALKHFETSGVMQGLRTGSPEAQQTFTQTFARSGVVPKEVTELLGNMLNSPNAETAQYGLSTLSQMRARNRNAFEAAVPKALSETASAWETIQRYTPPGEEGAALQRINNWRSPEQRQMREALAEEAADTLAEITPDDMLKDLQGGLGERLLTRISPDAALAQLPSNPGTLALLHNDYTTLYSEYYSLFQDEDQTREFVAEQMQLNWGVDTLGGRNQLMYLAPDSPRSGYSPHNGSYDWMREDIVDSLGMEPGAQFELVSDGQSVADTAAGNPASYLVIEENDRGEFIPRLDEVGNPLRVRPTPSASLQRNVEARQTAANLDGAISSNNDRIFALTQENQFGEPDPSRDEEIQQLMIDNSRLRDQQREAESLAEQTGRSREETRQRLDRLRTRQGKFHELHNEHARLQRLIEEEEAALAAMGE